MLLKDAELIHFFKIFLFVANSRGYKRFDARLIFRWPVNRPLVELFFSPNREPNLSFVIISFEGTSLLILLGKVYMQFIVYKIVISHNFTAI